MKILSFQYLKRAILIMAPFVFFASCEKPTDDLGFNQVIGGTVDADSIHIPVVTYTTDIDSILVALQYQQQLILGGYSTTRLLGQYNSSYFGEAKAELVGQILPEQVNPDFGDNPVVDSVSLYLRTADSYGDTSQPMNIEVYELTDGFSRDSAYYSDYNPATGTLLGSVSNYYPRPNTARSFEGGQSAPFIKIPLDVNYFQSNFADVGDGNYEPFSTFDKFLEYFKGIKVTTTSAGAILYFNLGSNFSALRIHFHNDNDTSVVELDFEQDRSVVPINFSTFSQDYSSASFNLSTQDSVKGEERTYVQAMGGVATALKFDPQKIDSLQKEGLIINNALLELSTAMGTGDPAAPSSRMEIRALKGTDIGTRVLDFQDNTGDGNIRLGALRNNKYVFDLTRHVFNVLNTGENNTLAVVPVSRTAAANRTILRGGESANEKAKLVVYYTKP